MDSSIDYKNQKLILLDAGHGSIVHGHYVTSGKRYYGPHLSKTVQLAEGVYNKMIIHQVQHHLHLAGIPTHIINPENDDISLKARAFRVNQLHQKYKCFLLSVHQNGFKTSHAHGVEFFTSMGETKSDAMAEYMGMMFTRYFPNIKLRRSQINPSEYSKDFGYYILKSTRCPAILTEWGFMTNPKDRHRLLSDIGMLQQVAFLTDRLTDLYNYYL